MEESLTRAEANLTKAQNEITRAYRDAGPVETIILEKIIEDCAKLRQSIRALATAIAAVDSTNLYS